MCIKILKKKIKKFKGSLKWNRSDYDFKLLGITIVFIFYLIEGSTWNHRTYIYSRENYIKIVGSG